MTHARWLFIVVLIASVAMSGSAEMEFGGCSVTTKQDEMTDVFLHTLSCSREEGEAAAALAVCHPDGRKQIGLRPSKSLIIDEGEIVRIRYRFDQGAKVYRERWVWANQVFVSSSPRYVSRFIGNLSRSSNWIVFEARGTRDVIRIEGSDPEAAVKAWEDLCEDRA